MGEEVSTPNNEALVKREATMIGYSGGWSKYLDKVAAVSALIFLSLLIIGSAPLGLPFLVLSAFLLEFKYRTRHPVKLREEGIEVKDELVPWSDIKYRTTWGPLGIPLTPIKFHGFRLFLKSGKTVSFSSTMDGYDQLEKTLKQKISTLDSTESHEYSYPPGAVRGMRYVAAFMFVTIFALVYFLSSLFLLILFILAAGYFMFRNFWGGKETDGPRKMGDNWLIIAGFVLGAFILLFIFKNPSLALIVGLLPTVTLIFFPWHPRALSLKDDALFVGIDRAYPLVTMRTLHEKKKLLLLRYISLSFAKGDISVFPILENYESFRRDLEKRWEKARMQRFPSDEEILSPQREARTRMFRSSEVVELATPLPWQFWQHLRLLIHICLFLGVPAIAWFTPVGHVHIVGHFLREFVPIYIILYGGYFLMGTVPIYFSLYRSYKLDKEGIWIKGKMVLWKSIETVVLYKDLNQNRVVTLCDKDGVQIATIREDMADWDLALERIRSKIKEAKNSDPFVQDEGFFTRRAKAFKILRTIIVAFLLTLYLPLAVYSIRKNVDTLADPQRVVSTFPDNISFSGKFGIVTYHDIQGNPWYSFVINKFPGEECNPLKVTIYYLPENPIYGTVQGNVEDLITAFGGPPGRKERPFWRVIFSSVYWILILSLFIVIKGVLHKDLIPGLATLHFLPPDSPDLSFSKGERIQSSIRLGLHLLILLTLFFLSTYFLFPSIYPFRIPLQFSSIWIFLSLFFPLCFLISTGNYIIKVVPEFKRIRRSWRMDEDKISDGKTTLTLKEIQSITTFHDPVHKRFKNALIIGEKGQILLDGKLSCFEVIINKIKSRTGVIKEETSKAGAYLRRRLATIGIGRAVTGLLFLILFSTLLELTRIRFDMTSTQGEIVTVQKLGTFIFSWVSFIEYKDSQGSEWDDIAAHLDKEKESFEIKYLKELPMYWILDRHEENSFVLGFLSWFRIESGSGFISYIFIFWKILGYSLTALFIVLILWHIFGYLSGFPRVSIH